MKCCLCGEKIKGERYDAQPIMKGGCCENCNQMQVVPAKLNQVNKLK